MRRAVALGFVVLLSVGCTENKSSTPPSDAGPSAAPAAAIARGSTITGIVREQTPVEPYVYVRLETATGEVWAAVNQAPLAVGAEINVYDVMPMQKFESKTLKRTFEIIYFGSLVPSAGMSADAPSSGMPSAGMPANAGGSTTSMGAPQVDDAKVGKIAPASGTDARTIGALWAQKDQLAGGSVTVRGVVVKYNAGVMGKNWIHLQDGTGNAAAGTHDVTVTSLDAAALGDTITISGTVRTNRELGAGYTYLLLVEDAKVRPR